MRSFSTLEISSLKAISPNQEEFFSFCLKKYIKLDPAFSALHGRPGVGDKCAFYDKQRKETISVFSQPFQDAFFKISMKRPFQVTCSSKGNNLLSSDSLLFPTPFAPASVFYSIFNLPLPTSISGDSPAPRDLIPSLPCSTFSPCGGWLAPGPGQQEPGAVLALNHAALPDEGSATWTVCVKEGQGPLCRHGFVYYLGCKACSIS